jgi:hypothetical protein
VAYRNFTILARNLKHHPDSELGALEVEFGPLPMGRVWLDAKFDSSQFFKKVPQSKFVCKSYNRFTEARPSQFWKAEYDSESKSGRAKT